MAEQREVLPQSMVVEFAYPVTMKGEEVTQITIRKPKMKDMKAMASVSGTDLDREAWLMSCLSGMPVSDFDNLDLDQYQRVQEVLGKYTASSMMTI